MNKIVDFVAVRVAVFILFLLWFVYLWDSFALGALSAAAAVTVLSALVGVLGRNLRRAPYNADSLSKQIALLGNSYALNLLFKAEGSLLLADGATLLNNGTLYFGAFRFGDCSVEDVASAYRTSVAENADNVTVVCRGVTRDAIALSNTLSIPIRFIKTPYIYKKLKQKNALPALVFTKKTAFSGFSVGNLLNGVLSENNTKFFVFTGSILAVMSFITPLKLYYLVMSSLSLLAAIASVLYPKLRSSLSSKRH